MIRRVLYSATYKNNTFTIECWEGTPLGVVWNEQKQYYLPGDVVAITDNNGNCALFMKGMC